MELVRLTLQMGAPYITDVTIVTANLNRTYISKGDQLLISHFTSLFIFTAIPSCNVSNCATNCIRCRTNILIQTKAHSYRHVCQHREPAAVRDGENGNRYDLKLQNQACSETEMLPFWWNFRCSQWWKFRRNDISVWARHQHNTLIIQSENRDGW